MSNPTIPNATLANIRRTIYDATWGTNPVGYVDLVKPDLKLKYEPIKVGTFGVVKLGDRFVGLDDASKITLRLRELNITQFQNMCPWVSVFTSNPALPLTPPINVDLYSYAKTLTLHPRDAGVTGTPAAGLTPTTAEDLNLIAAVPITAVSAPPRDNLKDDTLDVDFVLYPARDLLPALVYGWLGAIPSGGS